MVEARGMLPPHVPDEVYNERAAFSCSQYIYDQAFMQNNTLLNTKALHISDYVLYNVGAVQLVRKYSTFTHDLVLYGLLLHE